MEKLVEEIRAEFPHRSEYGVVWGYEPSLKCTTEYAKVSLVFVKNWILRMTYLKTIIAACLGGILLPFLP